MPTLKEILAERKRAAANVQADTQTDTQVADEFKVIHIPTPLDAFYAFFDGCTDF